MIKASTKFLTALMAMALTVSCTPVSPAVELAASGDGRLLLKTKEPAWFQVLAVYDSDGFVWKIASEKPGFKTFPVTYGDVPAGYSEISSLKGLTPGRRYGVMICGGEFEIEFRQEFVMLARSADLGLISTTPDIELQSPDDRDDLRRAAAIERGAEVPTVERCSRAVVTS